MNTYKLKAPYESPLDDSVVLDARIISGTDREKIGLGKKVIDLSVETKLYIPVHNSTAVHNPALNSNIEAGHHSEIASLNNSSDLLAVGTVLAGSTVLNSVLHAILGTASSSHI